MEQLSEQLLERAVVHCEDLRASVSCFRGDCRSFLGFLLIGIAVAPLSMSRSRIDTDMSFPLLMFIKLMLLLRSIVAQFVLVRLNNSDNFLHIWVAASRDNLGVRCGFGRKRLYRLFALFILTHSRYPWLSKNIGIKQTPEIQNPKTMHQLSLFISTRASS